MAAGSYGSLSVRLSAARLSAAQLRRSRPKDGGAPNNSHIAKFNVVQAQPRGLEVLLKGVQVTGEVNVHTFEVPHQRTALFRSVCQRRFSRVDRKVL